MGVEIKSETYHLEVSAPDKANFDLYIVGDAGFIYNFKGNPAPHKCLKPYIKQMILEFEIDTLEIPLAATQAKTLLRGVGKELHGEIISEFQENKKKMAVVRFALSR